MSNGGSIWWLVFVAVGGVLAAVGVGVLFYRRRGSRAKVQDVHRTAPVTAALVEAAPAQTVAEPVRVVATAAVRAMFTGTPSAPPAVSPTAECPEGTVQRGRLVETRGPLGCLTSDARVHVRVVGDGDNVQEGDYDPDILAHDTSPRVLRELSTGQHSWTFRLYTVELSVPMERLTVGCYERLVCRGGRWVSDGRIRVDQQQVAYTHVIRREELTGQEWRKLMPELWTFLRRAIADRDRMSTFCG